VAEEIKDREQIVFELQSLIDEVDPKTRRGGVDLRTRRTFDKITIDKVRREAEQAILFEPGSALPSMWRTSPSLT
jgi:hypothetical protein